MDQDKVLQQIVKQLSVLIDGIGTDLVNRKQQAELFKKKIDDLQMNQRASQDSITSIQNSMETLKRLVDNLSKSNKLSTDSETTPSIDIETIKDQVAEAAKASVEPLMATLMEKSTATVDSPHTEGHEAIIRDLLEQYQSFSKQLNENAQEISQTLKNMKQSNTDIVNASMESFRSQALETLSQIDHAKDVCLQDFEAKYRELSVHMAAAEEKQIKKHTNALKDLQVAAVKNITRNNPTLLAAMTIATIVIASFGMGWYWNNNSKAASYACALYYNQAYAPFSGKVATPEDLQAVEAWMKQYREDHAQEVQHGKDFWTYTK